MSILEGKKTAITLAKLSFEKINIEERCDLHGFESFQNEEMPVRIFGNDAIFNKSNLELILKDSRDSVKLNHYLLFSHYLLSDIPFTPSDEYITFRKIPGGQFYWNPFLAKTLKPLLKFIGNDIEKLKRGLSKFDWKQDNYGDFSAKIHVVGKVYVVLIYHLGDDEFPTNADILFDSTISKVYKAEDVSVLSSEICFGIFKN